MFVWFVLVAESSNLLVLMCKYTRIYLSILLLMIIFGYFKQCCHEPVFMFFGEHACAFLLGVFLGVDIHGYPDWLYQFRLPPAVSENSTCSRALLPFNIACVFHFKLCGVTHLFYYFVKVIVDSYAAITDLVHLPSSPTGSILQNDTISSQPIYWHWCNPQIFRFP